MSMDIGLHKKCPWGGDSFHNAFLMNVFIALKGTHFLFLFAFTAAGVVPCGGRKTSPVRQP